MNLVDYVPRPCEACGDPRWGVQSITGLFDEDVNRAYVTVQWMCAGCGRLTLVGEGAPAGEELDEEPAETWTCDRCGVEFNNNDALWSHACVVVDDE